ncbi:MAG TPA: proline dehydrogenase family protein [Acidimicrobiia bacterium]|jgi:proline dehydrogenase|nr:proline dehydrogenase family protein [Acidimicrobiia bacterium]
MAVAGAAPVEKLFTSTSPGRAVAERFVAGDTLDQAIAVARQLNQEGFLVSLDLLGEEVHDRDSALAANKEYLESLDRIRDEGLDANISVKPTQLGLAIDERLAMDAISELGARAGEVGTTVTIDMESSRYTEATVRLFERGQEASGNFGVALQAALRRTPADLERLIPLGGHIRLCKGAYVEPEELALQSSSGIDAAFARQLRTLMEAESTIPAVATHDSDLIELAVDLAGRRRGPFELQMLYGVRRDLQRRLISEGHPLRIYLPFGSQWYPYLTRRLAERPANALFLARALFSRD